MKQFMHNALKTYMQRFPIDKGKERILARFWRPLSFGDYQRQDCLTDYSVDVWMNFDITHYIQRHIYFYGNYENDVTQYWLAQAARAEVVFDVGANVGVYSLLAAIKNPAATIHAFEPTPEILDAFQANLALNKVNNVVINRQAVGRTSGAAYLRRCTGIDGSNEGMNFVSDLQDAEVDTHPVEVISIDDYCRHLQISQIDLVKMDIKGGEFEALAGAETMLRQGAVACIVMELVEWTAQRGGHTTREIRELLLDHKYNLYNLEHGQLLPLGLEAPASSANIVALATQVH